MNTSAVEEERRAHDLVCSSTTMETAAAQEDDWLRRREELVFTAQLAEKAARYHDMLSAMCAIAKMGMGFTSEEMSLFSDSWCQIIEEKRTALKVVRVFQEEHENEKVWHLYAQTAARKFQVKLESEIRETCYDVIEVIAKSLIHASYTPKDTIFYYEMMAHCFAAIAQMLNESLDRMSGVSHAPTEASNLRDESTKMVDRALELQMSALELAKERLCPTDPVRLSAAMKMSGFYAMKNGNAMALQLLKDTIREAESQLESSDDESVIVESNDTNKCMLLLKERLTVLESEKQQQLTGKLVDESHMMQGRKPEEAKTEPCLSEDEESSYEDVRYIPI